MGVSCLKLPEACKPKALEAMCQAVKTVLEHKAIDAVPADAYVPRNEQIDSRIMLIDKGANLTDDFRPNG
eukprot:16433175-Heterocapsa_arctica.AAC.1